MTTLIKLSAAGLLTGLVMLVGVSAVQAQVMEQDQRQEVEVNCEVGAYGQTSTCSARAEGEQRQRILGSGVVLRADGRTVRIHDITSVDTSMPGIELLTAATGVVTTAGYGLLKVLNRA